MKKSLQDKLEEFLQAQLGSEYGEMTLEKVRCILHNGKLTEIQLEDGNKKVVLREGEKWKTVK